MGSTYARINLGGTTGNINTHSITIIGRHSSAGIRTIVDLSTLGSQRPVFGTGYTVGVSSNRTPTSTSDGVSLFTDPGYIFYFLLNQLEEILCHITYTDRRG